MTTLAATNPTLLDVAKRLDPDGTIATVVEILNQTNEILFDATYVEANGVLNHRTTIRTGIPTPTWRRMYEGVQPTKSTTRQVTDTIGNMEMFIKVDKDAADINGNTAAFMLSESIPHFQGMNHELAQTVIYGNEGTAPSEFTGIMPRYSDLSAESGDNIITGGGAGTDNTSILLLVWGPNTIHMLAPKGAPTGIQYTDLGLVIDQNTGQVSSGQGGYSQVYMQHLKMQVGMSVRDWRYGVRICNIDKSLLNKDASGSSANLPDLMFEAINRIPSLAMGRAAFYMSRDTLTKLRQQIANGVSNSTLTVDNVGGNMVTSFQGIPVRRVDAMAADEALVS